MPAAQAVGLKPFDEFGAGKIAEAETAQIHPLVTVLDRSAQYDVSRIGTPWTRALYDGDFHLSAVPDGLPALSLVFVQSREGNTGADDPAELGGGAADKHLIYEGLSRVAADGVLAGARTADGENVFFGIWHPELVALRAALGLPRHPAQIVVTGRGCIDVARSRVFNAPDVPVYVLVEPEACDRLSEEARHRPWVRMVPIEQDGLRGALARLRRDFGITRISAVGGRTVASALLDAGTVQDLYLTTTARSGGEPDTPLYTGERPPALDAIVTKRSTDPEAPFTFQHLAVTSSRSAATPRR